MKNILIYSNCHGKNLNFFFNNHPQTKNIFKCESILNYPNLIKEVINKNDLKLIKNCDIFIYQV